MAGRSSLNSGASSLWPTFGQALRRVLDHQRKLHRWARNEPERRFADVFNLVCDRATLLVAWERVAGNNGARTAGVDAVTRADIEAVGVLVFLEDLRSSLAGRHVRRVTGPAGEDPQNGRQDARAGNSDPPGPGGADGPQADHGTDLRGRFYPSS